MLEKLDWFVAILVAISLAVVTAEASLGQSVAVRVPGEHWNSVVPNAAWPPNTMTAEMRRWEAILDQSYPSRFNESMTGRELVEELNRLGLPTILSRSARDDSLDYDNQIVLPLPNSSLRTRLLGGLKETNATICFVENRIGIISNDDAEDPNYFLTITYDVTALVGPDPYDLMDSITQSLDPDAWMETGQGLGTIVANQVNGRHLITISQEYAIHRGVQRFLSGINRLSGASQLSHSSRAVSVPSESRSVALPTRRVNFGSGLGGGFFRVPEQKAASFRK